MAAPGKTNGQAAVGPPNGSLGGKRDMAHIDDIVRYQLDVNPHATIDHLINYAEESLLRAESTKEWGRKDYALRDYLKATAVIVEIIPKNKDFVGLKGDRQMAMAKYNSLLRRVSAASTEFEAIKEMIQADNARTGVQPTAQRPSSSGNAVTPAPRGPEIVQNRDVKNGEFVGNGNVNGSPSSQRTAPSPAKAKPAIHPKPKGLLGNAIKPGVGGASATSKTPQDLAERFANLRGGGKALPTQDHRIRTQAIPIPPTQLPPAVPPSRPTISVPHPLPDLPKVPDAIYSPARGTVSSHAAELPSSTPRGMFSRTNSMAALSTTMKSPPAADYFAQAPPSGRSSSSTQPRRVSIPDGDTVTVKKLLSLMQAGSREVQVLLIDVRTRHEFDAGHIMSQSTICIEPDVLQRNNISANEISESLVLAPTSEAHLFDKRHDFDAVVFYDQESKKLPGSRGSQVDNAIMGLYNALSYYDFASDRESKKPKLLEGGIDSWTDVMGSVSLKTSSTASGQPTKTAKPVLRRSTLSRTATKYIARPIQDPAEAKRWEESLNDLENRALVRNKEDFLRRYPSASALQESMTSPVDKELKSHRLLGHVPPPEAYASALPSPPTRPAPAVPRPSHSGLMENDDEDHYTRAKMANATRADRVRTTTGLENPGNWCYANSSLQALFGSLPFADDLSSNAWVNKYKVPMKKEEKIKHPQLLCKMLASLFHWMGDGTFVSMKAKTLMDYSKSIHMKSQTRHDETVVFGGRYQQDAQEFFNFLLSHVHDETNLRRNRVGEATQPFWRAGDNRVATAHAYWSEYKQFNDSMVTEYWRALEARLLECQSCNHQMPPTHQVIDLLILTIPAADKRYEMRQLLDHYAEPEMLDDYKCDHCNKTGRTRHLTRLVRLPDLLCVSFSRFHGIDSKINTPISFPVRGLDLTPYTIQENEPAPDSIREHEFNERFIYDLYGVIVHSGSLKSGHYRAYMKQEGAADPHAWNLFDDSRVTAVRIGSGDRSDRVRDLYRDSNGASAYMAFYRRQLSP